MFGFLHFYLLHVSTENLAPITLENLFVLLTLFDLLVLVSMLHFHVFEKFWSIFEPLYCSRIEFEWNLMFAGFWQLLFCCYCFKWGCLMVFGPMLPSVVICLCFLVRVNVAFSCHLYQDVLSAAYH